MILALLFLWTMTWVYTQEFEVKELNWDGLIELSKNYLYDAVLANIENLEPSDGIHYFVWGEALLHSKSEQAFQELNEGKNLSSSVTEALEKAKEKLNQAKEKPLSDQKKKMAESYIHIIDCLLAENAALRPLPGIADVRKKVDEEIGSGENPHDQIKSYILDKAAEKSTFSVQKVKDIQEQQKNIVKACSNFDSVADTIKQAGNNMEGRKEKKEKLDNKVNELVTKLEDAGWTLDKDCQECPEDVKTDFVKAFQYLNTLQKQLPQIGQKAQDLVDRIGGLDFTEELRKLVDMLFEKEGVLKERAKLLFEIEKEWLK